VLEELRRGVTEQRPGELRGGLPTGGEDDAAGPRADDVDPAGHDVGGHVARDREEVLVLADQGDPRVLGDRLDRRLVDQLGDDRAGLAGPPALAGVRRRHLLSSLALVDRSGRNDIGELASSFTGQPPAAAGRAARACRGSRRR
jgi:hypothetical protein